MKSKILVVDDEEDILALLQFNLSKNGYEPICVESGEEALDIVKDIQPDLIILDLMLTGIGGYEVSTKLKVNDTTKNIPIIMLTARGEEKDIVAGLNRGVDDYITKPFSIKVLMAKIEMIIKKNRSKDDKENIISVGDLTIHTEKHEATIKGEVLNLTCSEFKFLKFLARKPGWAFSRVQMVEAVKGDDYPVSDRSVDVAMMELRKKLGNHSQMIETVRGVGYRFRSNSSK
jgi:DNA-binding response OmpR family regulator